MRAGVVLVTGGSRGIGAATARAAAAAGWSVALTYRDDEAAAAGVVAGIGAVAAAVLWLLGEAAGYCTGSVLDVAGGR